MPYIVLSDDQAKILREAAGLVEVRDEQGHVLARVVPDEAAIVAEAKRRLAEGGPRYSGAEIQARLQKLNEISQREELDEAKVKELIRKMRAGEEV
jgi:hypothetical protein